MLNGMRIFDFGLAISIAFCSAAFPPIIPPLSPWNRNLTTDCSAIQVKTSLTIFFESVFKLSVSAVPDTSQIIGLVIFSSLPSHVMHFVKKLVLFYVYVELSRQQNG
jgi:hypothetical protein